jgi:hypothetical protein
LCESTPGPREIQASISDYDDPLNNFEWLCRRCNHAKKQALRGAYITLTCELCRGVFYNFVHAVKDGCGRYCSNKCRDGAQIGVPVANRDGRAKKPGPRARAKAKRALAEAALAR